MLTVEEGYEVTFDGSTKHIASVREDGYGTTLEFDDEPGEWYIFETHEEAGQAARKYWEDLANDDPAEFRAIVGDEALIGWSLGQSRAVGATAVSSLNEWLDLWLDVPEEEFARYDGNEWEGTIQDPDHECDEAPCVLYRCN